MKPIILFILIGLTFNTCLKDEFEYPPTIYLTSSNSPFYLNSKEARFYKDISYGIDKKQVFDILLPNSKKSTSLCIFIHGGGFIAGDKTDFYSNNNYIKLVNILIDHNIAVAFINYRFIEPYDTEGVIKCLNDSKTALQTIRFFSNIFRLDKSKVVILGNSAGAGTALWIGLNDDLADINNKNLISRESTRIYGLVSIDTQASYDLLNWSDDIFKQYQKVGFNSESIKNLLTQQWIETAFGITKEKNLYSKEIIGYRNDVNMLKLMSCDDPELYISNTGINYSIPVNKIELTHHPLHLKALYDKSILTNVSGYFYCPELEINTTNGLKIEKFILNKLAE